MRITGVEVTGLFGIFHHTVPLTPSERITIIHGPNGFGKTILLQMIHALFGQHYYELRRIPFAEFAVSFDNATSVRVVKHPTSVQGGRETSQLKIELIHNGRIAETAPLKPVTSDSIEFPLELIDREIAELERVGPETWVSLRTREELSLEEVLSRFGHRLPFGRRVRQPSQVPQWLRAIVESVQVHFIEAQRLLTFLPRRREYEPKRSMFPAVEAYSEELVALIQAKLAEYGTLSQSLDRTFPARLIGRAEAPLLSEPQIRQSLSALEEKRSRLMAAGLLDQGKEAGFGELPAKIDQTNRSVLSVYVRDVEEKLKVFDELTNKIDLLVSVINHRFLYKKVSISKKKGFVFRSSAGDDLSVTMLSSGEQHEVVLLFGLLFKVVAGALVLIDEPELSLHVLWQQQFLRDLDEITRLGGFDVLLATHSPQIIHDRWDLTVELNGPSVEPTPDAQ